MTADSKRIVTKLTLRDTISAQIESGKYISQDHSIHEWRNRSCFLCYEIAFRDS